MNDKQGFSTEGGGATLLDDETRTLSPADKIHPAITKEQVEKVVKDEILKLQNQADKLNEEAEVLAQGDNEKATNAKLRAAKNAERVAEFTSQVRIQMRDHLCTLNIGRMKKAFNVNVPLKDCLYTLNMLVTDYSTLTSMQEASKRSRKQSKIGADYSGMGQIIGKEGADLSGEAA